MRADFVYSMNRVPLRYLSITCSFFFSSLRSAATWLLSYAAISISVGMSMMPLSLGAICPSAGGMTGTLDISASETEPTLTTPPSVSSVSVSTAICLGCASGFPSVSATFSLKCEPPRLVPTPPVSGVTPSDANRVPAGRSTASPLDSIAMQNLSFLMYPHRRKRIYGFSVPISVSDTKAGDTP